MGNISMAKTTKCSPANTSGIRSKSRLSRLKRASQPKLRSTTQRRGSSTKPFFAFIGRRDRQRYQMAQRIDRHMHFAAFAPFVAVVACRRPALAATLQGPAIDDDRAGLALAALGTADDRAQVAHHRRKAPCIVPAPKLLVHHRPGRQIIGQHAPRGTGPRQPAQRIEHFAQAVAPLGRLLVNQG